MCGIAGILDLSCHEIPGLERQLSVMNALQAHRGPDGHGVWVHPKKKVGLAHRRLSIIDIATGSQPMRGSDGSWVVYNGEIYNFKELRRELDETRFQTASDTEVILEGYRRWGTSCVERFRGMFAFALWDEQQQLLFCARDRVGIKPFYLTLANNRFHFASEAKALLPFVPDISIDERALKDYLLFQFLLDGKTLFKGIEELPPATLLTIHDGKITKKRYWDCRYEHLQGLPDERITEQLRDILSETTTLHSRSDVKMGAYVSGGIDSSLVTALMCNMGTSELMGVVGKFTENQAYDESHYARVLAKHSGFDLCEVTIRPRDFVETIERVSYCLDFPVAGPGSFNQYIVAREASKYRKVMFGGQGGDEIFGGYARYLVAYLEHAMARGIDAEDSDLSPQADLMLILPHLASLKSYKPMMRDFFREGLFDQPDARYYRLINRGSELSSEIHWDLLGSYSPADSLHQIFWAENVTSASYVDRMTHFDFKTLLPALLHIEDRVSMAHGVESRVPLLDHKLIEFAATLPFAYKYRDGILKRPLRDAAQHIVPTEILKRNDKMGFPIPLHEWLSGELKSFVLDIFSSAAARSRGFWNHQQVLDSLLSERQYGRRTWGLLSLELWHRNFIDRSREFLYVAREDAQAEDIA